MPELARTIVSRIRAFIGNRRRAPRHPVQLPFTVTILGRKLSTNGGRRKSWVDGHTLDISTSGLALVVPAIRIGEHYLVGDDRRLIVRLELPTGTVEMEVKPVRYESLEEHETEFGYLIGVHIEVMNERDRAAYENFVHRVLRHAPLD